MANSLHSNLDDLAQKFAEIRGASIQELLAERGGALRRGPSRPRRTSTTKASPTAARASAPARKLGRIPRRAAEDIAKALDPVVALVKSNKDGLRAEQIRGALKLDMREVPRIIKAGLSTKKLKKHGQKRSTTYWATA